MTFAGINYLAVAVAAVVAFAFGFAWYGLLRQRWVAALGRSEQELRPGGRPPTAALALTFLAELLMAYMLAGIIGHLATYTLAAGLITGLAVWAGFVFTTLVANHRFQQASWALTAIDGGHWLGVLLIQGAVIAALGV
jgi:hypothetical protein